MRCVTPVRWRHVLLAVFFVGLGAFSASGQTRGDDPYARLVRSSFKYGDKDIRDNVLALCSIPASAMDEGGRFRLSYYMREWETVRDTLHKMKPKTAEDVYRKIIRDLTRERVPVMAVDDFYGLLDACPMAPDDGLLKNLGNLAQVIVRPEEMDMLGTRLELGTAFFGGEDFAKRLNLGRVMLQADFDKLALEYLPGPSDMGGIKDETVHREILQFHKMREELTGGKPGERTTEQLTEEFSEVTEAFFGDVAARGKARQDLLPFFGRRLPHGVVLDAVEKRVVGPGQDVVPAYVARLSEIFADYRGKNAVPVVRLNNAVLQVKLVDLLAANVDLKAAPWNPVVISLAGNWIAEAEEMVREKAVLEKTGKNESFVSSRDLLATMPRGVWLQALPEGFRERVLIQHVRVLMSYGKWDQAFAEIVAVNRRNPSAATQLTTECLERWARLNDPTIPADVKEQFEITQQQILVTPIVAARNLSYFAELMALMRKNKVPVEDLDYLLDVYERSQSTVDVYQREDLEKVFGPVTALDEASFSVLTQRMQVGLGGRWRETGVHDGPTTLAMVRAGYAMTLGMIDDWSAEHPEDWKALRAAGVMASDWADFEYFQELAKSPKRQALALYDEKNKLSQAYFGMAAQRYLKHIENNVKLVETEETLFVTWFQHLMGFNSNGDVNLSKAASRAVLEEIREMIHSLPEGVAQTQMAALSSYVDQMTGDPKALHPNMKFKFMESALVITADTSFSEATSDKVEYLETLLDGVQLESRIDGPNTVWRKEDVGIVVSLRHTDVMGRQIRFESVVGAAAAPKPADKARKMMATDTVRNDLESNILEVLSPFFDVRSITLSPVDVKPRPTKQPGWERTVLAYVVVRAKGVSVDEIPQMTLDLHFVDKSGPVTLPVRSAVRLIQMKEGRAEPRKVDDLQLTQTFDTRNLYTTGELKLTVTAFGTGLMPRLSDLVDLRPLEQSIEVRQIVLEEGPVVRQILSWSDDVEVTSERRWRVELDGEAILQADTQLPLYYPVPHDAEAEVRNDYFVDADVAVAAEPYALIGKEETPELVMGVGGQLEAVDKTPRWWRWAGFGAAVLLALVVLAVLVRRKSSATRPLRAADVFRMPTRMEPFAVVKLLRNLLASDLVHLSDQQRRALTDEMRRVELACFEPDGEGLPNAELKRVAQNALETCC